jgi:hypothetical protein
MILRFAFLVALICIGAVHHAKAQEVLVFCVICLQLTIVQYVPSIRQNVQNELPSMRVYIHNVTVTFTRGSANFLYRVDFYDDEGKLITREAIHSFTRQNVATGDVIDVGFTGDILIPESAQFVRFWGFVGNAGGYLGVRIPDRNEIMAIQIFAFRHKPNGPWAMQQPDATTQIDVRFCYDGC